MGQTLYWALFIQPTQTGIVSIIPTLYIRKGQPGEVK